MLRTLLISLLFTSPALAGEACRSFDATKQEGPKYTFTNCNASQRAYCEQLEKLRAEAFEKGKGKDLPYTCKCLDQEFFANLPQDCPESIERAIRHYSASDPNFAAPVEDRTRPTPPMPAADQPVDDFSDLFPDQNMGSNPVSDPRFDAGTGPDADSD